MDFYQFGEQLQCISDLLEEIRTLNKGNSPDFRDEPYNYDFELVKYLLHEKIEQLKKEGVTYD